MMMTNFCLVALFCFFQDPSYQDGQKPDLSGYYPRQVSSLYDDCSPQPGDTPLVLDLAGDGFLFSGPERGVWFDLYGNGDPRLFQWVAGIDDAFLARDLNKNGVVDDGHELFGSGTHLLLNENRLAPNGFVGLAQFDNPKLGGNDDGFITSADLVWDELALWLDTDFDGVSTADEMYQLQWFNITAIPTIPRDLYGHVDAFGNRLQLWAWVYQWDYQHKIDMVDVFLRRITQDTPAKRYPHVAEGPLFPPLPSMDYLEKTMLKPGTKLEPVPFIESRGLHYQKAKSEIQEMAKAKNPLPPGVIVHEDGGLTITGALQPDLMDLRGMFSTLASCFRVEEGELERFYHKGLSPDEIAILRDWAVGKHAYQQAGEKAQAQFYESHQSKSPQQKLSLAELQRDWYRTGHDAFITSWSREMLESVSPQAQRILIDYLYERLVPACQASD